MSSVKVNPFYNQFTPSIKQAINEPTLDSKSALAYLKTVIKKHKKTKVNFGSLGYITYKRTYSRVLTKKKTEEYLQTIERVISGVINKLNVPFTKREIDLFVESMLNLEINVSGRDLWQIGAKLFEEGNMSSLINCWYFNIDRWSAFHKIFDMLMLGGGVGFGVKAEYINKLATLTNKVKLVHINEYNRSDKDNTEIIIKVGDSREGWCKLLDTVIQMHQITNDVTLVVDPSDVRKAGEPIKGFGGVASGFDSYWDGLQVINQILNSTLDKPVAEVGRLNSVEVTDLVCIIAHIVVSGNVRRSALLALGDVNDKAFYTMKRWDLYKTKTDADYKDKSVSGAYQQALNGKIPNYRYNANLSIDVADFKDIEQEVWNGFINAGEPIGFVNIKNARKFGRINPNDKKYYDYLFGENELVDPEVDGVNPCAEATLPTNSNCCLAEVYLNNFDLNFDVSNLDKTTNFDDVVAKLAILYKIKKHVTQAHYHYSEIKDRINKDSRIGIGLTGIMQKYAEKNFDRIISDMYEYLRTYDFFYSQKHNLPYAIKLTVIKPSGTLSLLAGSTSGIHPAYSRYYLRAIRISATSDLWKLAEQNGYKVEDDLRESGTKVVYFPLKESDETVIAEDFDAIKQMEAVKKMQSIWADQAVSVTVYYDKNNLESIKKWLAENYNDGIKTISFLQHSGHGFDQAPLTPITQEEYERYSKRVKPILDMSDFSNIEDDLDNLESCEGGICPVR